MGAHSVQKLERHPSGLSNSETIHPHVCGGGVCVQRRALQALGVLGGGVALHAGATALGAEWERRRAPTACSLVLKAQPTGAPHTQWEGR
jgi:hypothetical protein